MHETWTLLDDGSPALPDDVAPLLRERIAAERLETWLVSASGRSLAFITNTERAMVMLLDHEGDPGEHLVDPGAEDWSDGFLLSNGQDDEYPDEDTVPVDDAIRAVAHVLATGAWPQDARWVADR